MEKVKVCDALCGSGKTSAAITMMNENPDKRFIFVTQYISEAERIKAACPDRHFILPDSVSAGGTKLSDARSLMRKGRNIATTHALFSIFDDETKSLLKEHHYVLILDEVIDIISLSGMQRNDINILIQSNSIKENGEYVEWINDEYERGEGGRFREDMNRAKSKNLLKLGKDYYFWMFPPELFGSFEEAYILTYMFEAQEMASFFKIYNIEYELIGTIKTASGFRFCKIEEMDRRRELRDKIHVLKNKKLNKIGDKRNAMSVMWYNRALAEENDNGSGELSELRKNMSNIFKNVWKAKSQKIMWTTYKPFKEELSQKGYKGGFLTYNKRASNEYANRTHLAYCVNNFPRPMEARYYQEHGAKMNSDMYALSILVQWVFRSAIRNGEEIWVYIPSARMRSLFTRWLDNLAEGKDLEAIKFNTEKNKKIKGA